ncbi:MAG: class I SAM-dependent methyltransferase [Motilibacteraceae bacterium]
MHLRAREGPHRGTGLHEVHRSPVPRGWALAWRLGLTPWERPGERGADQVDDLLGPAPRPGARLLDISCGSGLHAVRQAARGWTVTGVEVIPQALERARRRARDAGAQVEWVRGDASHLARLVPAGIDALLDVGCLHVLDDHRRRAWAEGVQAVSVPGARLVLLAFAPKRGPRPGPRGIADEDVSSLLPGWELVERARPAVRAPGPFGSAEDRFLVLVRR